MTNNGNVSEQVIAQFEKELLVFNRVALKKVIDDSLLEIEPINFIEQVVVPVLEKIGSGWEDGSIALSQIYMGGKVCEELIDEILPPKAPERIDQPNMAICVLEDHHFLGKRIVYATLRASGFELEDFGRTTVDELVDKVIQSETKILLISVLMLPSALLVKEVKEKLDARGVEVKLVVGGAPFCFDSNLWQEVGADAMCYLASEAPKAVRDMSGRA